MRNTKRLISYVRTVIERDDPVDTERLGWQLEALDNLMEVLPSYMVPDAFDDILGKEEPELAE